MAAGATHRVAEITTAPNTFIGKTVTVVAEVDEVYGPRAFVTFFGKDTKAAVVELGTGRVVRRTVPAHPLIGAGQPITG